MSSPETPAEPMPGSLTPPFISETAQRLYERLPRAYRYMDSQNDYALKRYLAACAVVPGKIDDLVDRIRGSRPIGPAQPEPWDLDADDLARWRDERRNLPSALADPVLADASWLTWLAQLVGAYLDPRASLTERRDTIRFATSGYRGGTKAALADAARSALTGSRYVLVQPFTRPDGIAATLWDITLRTRTSETPVTSQQLIDTVIRKGAKPAGAVLHHGSFGTSWDIVEARFPTWDDWEARTWDQIEEAGATYEVPDNLAPNPSFETNVTGYTPVAQGGGSVPTWALAPGQGVDAANAGRLSKVGATGGMRLRSVVINDPRILGDRDYTFAVSARPSAALPVSLEVDWLNSTGTPISTTTQAMGTATAGQWNRANMTSQHHSPVGAARAQINVVATGTIAAGVTLDLDAMLFRLITTGGG